MNAATAMPVGTLTYASPDVRTSPPRTALRMIGAALLRGLGIVLTTLRLLIAGLGYAVLGAGVALRFVFTLVAMILLFVGGLRWDVVKRRTLVAANWVDARVLGTLGLLRRVLRLRSTDGVA